MFILSNLKKISLSRSDAKKVCRAIVKRWQTSSAAREQILEEAKADDAMNVPPTIPLSYAYLEAWQTGENLNGFKEISKLVFQLEDSDFALLNAVCKEDRHRCIIYSKSRPPSLEKQGQDLRDLLDIMVIVQYQANNLA